VNKDFHHVAGAFKLDLMQSDSSSEFMCTLLYRFSGLPLRSS